MSGLLNPGGQQFRHDRGAADPQVAAALSAYLAGQGSEQAALGALASARLLVPVVATLAGRTDPADAAQAGKNPADAAQAGKNPADAAQAGMNPPDAAQADKNPADAAQAGQNPADAAQAGKNSEMALPTLIGRDGRPALLAFTGLDALARWRPDARPVPAEAHRVWRAAVAEGCAVVIDVAGPVPLAVEGARLAALAAGRPVPPPHEDPDIRAEVEAAVAREPSIAGFTLAPGRLDGTDLAVTLRLAAGDHGPVLTRAANTIAARLAGRLRRGLEFTAAPEP